MKNIAIILSASGEASIKVAEFFKDSSSIRVTIAVTDRENAAATVPLEESGIPVIYIPREKWLETPSELLSLLASKETDIIVLDDFRGMMPEDVALAYRDRIVVTDSPDEAPAKVVEALRRLLENDAASPKPVVPETPGSVEEEWADTLKMNYDTTRLRTTPPPIPGVGHGVSYSPFAQVKPQVEEERRPMPSTYLVWSVLATVFCCLIPGIVAIIFSSQVSSKYFAGDYEGAVRSSERAQIWIIVSFVLGVLSATLYMPIMMIVP